MQRGEASKGEVAVQYFKEIFQDSEITDFHNSFTDFEPRVHDNVNESLIADVTREETRQAVFLSTLLKVQGLMEVYACFSNTIGRKLESKLQQRFSSFFKLVLFPWNGMSHIFVSSQRIPTLH